MWQSSFKMLTDLGNKPRCETLTYVDPITGETSDDYSATYTAIRSNVTDARGIARMGLCLPVECTQDELTNFDTRMINFMNFGISLLPQLGINIDTLVFNT